MAETPAKTLVSEFRQTLPWDYSMFARASTGQQMARRSWWQLTERLADLGKTILESTRAPLVPPACF